MRQTWTTFAPFGKFFCRNENALKAYPQKFEDFAFGTAFAISRIEIQIV